MESSFENQFAKSPSENQILSIHNDFILEIAMSAQTKRLAFQLRYRAYRRANMIPENAEAMLYDDYDFQPNTRVFLVWYQGKAVATVRSCVYSDVYDWTPTEGVQYFQAELKQKLNKKRRLLESNRFAVDPDFQGRQSLFARLLLFQAHGMNAACHACEYIITSVQANHIAFYQRFLGLESISIEARQYWLDVQGYLLIGQAEQCLAAILKRGMPGYEQEDLERFAEHAGISFSECQSIAA